MAKDWHAVAAAINTRLDEKAMTQKGLADASGVSVATVRKLQKVQPGEYGRPLLTALSIALGWAPGHLEAVAEGGSTPSDPSAELRRAIDAMRADLDDVRRRLDTVETVQRGGG